MKGLLYFIGELLLVFVSVQISSGLLPKDLKDQGGDVKILKDLDDFFEKELLQEAGRRGQFAVLYFGDRDVKKTLSPDVMKKCKDQIDKLTGSPNVFVTSPFPGFDVSQCPFLAARIQKKKGKGPPQGEHTENIIIDSLGTTCPPGIGNSKNANVYLYSFQRPCDNGLKACSKAIVDFSDKCSSRFSILVVGYKSTGHGTFTNDQFIEKSSRAVEIDISNAKRRLRLKYLYKNLLYMVENK